MATVARVREYRLFPRDTDKTPRVAHGRTADVSREVIRRPIDATPRKLADWR